jgi:hypothetical protein
MKDAEKNTIFQSLWMNWVQRTNKNRVLQRLVWYTLAFETAEKR